MTCKFTDLGNGVTMWSCSRGQRTYCCSCGNKAGFQCDYPLRGKMAGKTCSKHLCRSCGVAHPGDKHYCQPHARLVAKETANGSAT